LRVAGAELAAAGPGLVTSPNLLPGERRAVRQSSFAVAVGILLLAILGLGIACAVVPLLQAQALEAELSTRVAAAKERAEASQKLQKAIEEATQDGQFLLTRKRQAASVSEVLRSLTHALPDDTWLVELQVTVSEVQLSGFASSATALLSLLDERAGFSDAAFRSSVTQDAKLGREQFDISAKLKPRAER
jgi:general secretion pathway protein L